MVSKHCHISNEALDWIEGELLGDGSLCSFTCTARFRYSSKHLEYINYVSDTLAQFGIMQAGKIRRRVTCAVGYNYSSLSYTDLFDIWVMWYAYGNKQVPRDLKLTPTVCRQWYMGDGSIHKSSRAIFLATNAFPVADVKWLVQQLAGIGILATHHSARNVIYIPAKATKDFLGYIGECPVKCYKYKWKL